MTQDLSARLVALASAHELRIAVAESLTGGLLAAAIVSVPGASRVFTGGVVAYDTALKESLLDVDPVILSERGPVDEDVAAQMARGVRALCAVPDRAGGLDIGVSTTGVAGPDPDPQSGQAPGVVWVGLSMGEVSRAVRLTLEGDRAAVREAAVRAALQLAIDGVSERFPA